MIKQIEASFQIRKSSSRSRLVLWLLLISAIGLLQGANANASDTEALGGWPELARKSIENREYWVGETQAGLQAPNRTHNLRTFFSADHVRVQDRTASGSQALLQMSLSRFGRVGSMVEVSAGEVSSEGARVEIRRPGIVEWYKNAPNGLEQGFNLSARPVGEGVLVLEISMSGAHIVLQGDELLIETQAGRRLSYGKLVVLDATGRSIGAHFEMSGANLLGIFVDDEAALYPIVIDPLLTAVPDAQIESGQAGAFLGFSVASAGDVNNDGFDDVIIGAPFYDNGENNEGAAFIFLGSATGIVASGNPANAASILESNQDSAQLGISVAGAGDLNFDGYDDVIVGAPFYDTDALNPIETNEGAAFIFHGSATGVVAAGNPGNAASQLDGETSVIEFGSSVSTAGDVNGDGYDDVIIGAPLLSVAIGTEGGAFIFLGSPAGVVATADSGDAASMLISDTGGARLGSSVSGAGDVNGDGYDDVIVGAPFYDNFQTAEGAAFVFLGSATGVVALGNPGNAASQIESNQIGAQLGNSVADAGDVNGDGYADVIIGAHSWDGAATNGGIALIYQGGPSGIVAAGNPGNADSTIDWGQTFARLGTSVAGTGDVDADGFDDVIVAARGFNPTGQGAIFLFKGSLSGIVSLGNAGNADAQIDVQESGNVTQNSRSAGAGDVNGDGAADVLVGVPIGDVAAFVFHGTAPSITPSVVPALERVGLATLIGALIFSLLGAVRRPSDSGNPDRG